jgi:hypothetical protein
MALATTDRRVFTVQRPSGLFVIEALLRRFPVNKLELLSVMFGVTTGAVLFRIISLHHRGMKSLVCVESLANFSMTLQAF